MGHTLVDSEQQAKLFVTMEGQLLTANPAMICNKAAIFVASLCSIRHWLDGVRL